MDVMPVLGWAAHHNIGLHLAAELRHKPTLHPSVPDEHRARLRSLVKGLALPRQGHALQAAAAMYLLALRLFKRQYELAARLIPSVLSDVPFVGEESWVKGLFDGISDDPHPDGIALRLRIALQCTECNELPPFGGGGDERRCTGPLQLEALRQHRARTILRPLPYEGSCHIRDVAV
jgi:hypothetical protein